MKALVRLRNAPGANQEIHRHISKHIDLPLPARGAIVHDSWQHSFMPAGADPGCALGGPIAVAADGSVGPVSEQLVVRAATSTRNRPALWILRLAGTGHRRP
jgi:hypothetical protein